MPSASVSDGLIDTDTDERYKTIILTVVSRAIEAASTILDQTGIIQVNKNNFYKFNTIHCQIVQQSAVPIHININNR